VLFNFGDDILIIATVEPNLRTS